MDIFGNIDYDMSNVMNDIDDHESSIFNQRLSRNNFAWYISMFVKIFYVESSFTCS